MNNIRPFQQRAITLLPFLLFFLMGCAPSSSTTTSTDDALADDVETAVPLIDAEDAETVDSTDEALSSTTDAESNAVDEPLDGEDELDHWLPEQVNNPGLLEEFQDVITSGPDPYTDVQSQPIQIAFVYPSNDVSDFWVRNYLATTRRLDALGIAYETTEFSSRQIEHELQTTYTTEVLGDAELYDYVIFGPSNLATQADNLNRLAESDEFKTYVWAFHTPLKALEHQPDLWFDFSSSSGAQVMCEHVLQRLGNNVIFAATRGIPDVTDDQRSGDFIDCVSEKGDWDLAYEHYGAYQKEGGYDGTRFVMENHPEVLFIHNANTAMAMGSAEAQVEAGMQDDIFSTGWGGTSLEIEAIRRGELDATPMRMGDDIGVATAEAIRADLEDRADELPKVYLGRIIIAHNELGEELLSVLESEAFRYSNLEETADD